jgi:hydroxymethylglutaryl-CoA reductase (NADPH)
MPVIPPFLLRQLYVRGSLRAVDNGCAFTLRNSLASGTITGLALVIDGREVPAEQISVELNGREVAVVDITPEAPIIFGLNTEAIVRVTGLVPAPGTHALEVRPATRELGAISIQVQDEV